MPSGTAIKGGQEEEFQHVLLGNRLGSVCVHVYFCVYICVSTCMPLSVCECMYVCGMCICVVCWEREAEKGRKLKG